MVEIKERIPKFLGLDQHGVFEYGLALHSLKTDGVKLRDARIGAPPEDLLDRVATRTFTLMNHDFKGSVLAEKQREKFGQALEQTFGALRNCRLSFPTMADKIDGISQQIGERASLANDSLQKTIINSVLSDKLLPFFFLDGLTKPSPVLRAFCEGGAKAILDKNVGWFSTDPKAMIIIGLSSDHDPKKASIGLRCSLETCLYHLEDIKDEPQKRILGKQYGKALCFATERLSQKGIEHRRLEHGSEVINQVYYLFPGIEEMPDSPTKFRLIKEACWALFGTGNEEHFNEIRARAKTLLPIDTFLPSYHDVP